jgi:thiaminase/transcriptional activator TenA
MASLSGELWESIEHIYRAIIGHPFIQELASGTLAEERFRFYVIQDALYLSEFARALSLAAARAPSDEWVATFSEHAQTAILVERELHRGFLKEWGLTEADVKATPMAPTNLAYTSYLIAVAYSRPFAELLGALLPCYWIYWEVGKELEARGSPNPLYQRWIDTYSSEEFGQVCRKVLQLTDQVGEHLTGEAREAVRRHFITTSRYEYLFWDSAYRLEEWPL